MTTALLLPMANYSVDDVGAPCPTLNSGIANTILNRSPLHAWWKHPKLNPEWEETTSDAMDLGSAAHAVLLENRPELIHVVDVPDWRTNAAKETRQAARDAGLIPLLPADARIVDQMVAAANSAIDGSPDLVGLGQLKAEQTYVFQESATGTWIRTRPDWVTSDGAVIISYKTTGQSADAESYLKTIMNSGHDMQAAFEIRGVESAGGNVKAYVWAVQEAQAPYGVSLLGMAPDMRAYALDRFDAAVALWARCLESSFWPGYTRRVQYLSPPAWAVAQWEESNQ